jgi:hypothetical protein
VCADELRALLSGSQAHVDAGRAVIAAMSLRDAREMQVGVRNASNPTQSN